MKHSLKGKRKEQRPVTSKQINISDPSSRETINGITAKTITPILNSFTLKELFELIKVNKEFSIAIKAHPNFQAVLQIKKEFIVRKKDLLPDYEKLLLSKKNILEIGNEINYDRYSLEVLLKKDAEFIKKLIERNNINPQNGETFFSELLKRLIMKRIGLNGIFSLTRCALKKNCCYLNDALEDISEVYKIEFTFNNQFPMQSMSNLVNHSKKNIQLLNLNNNGLNDASAKFLFDSLKSFCPHLMTLDLSFNNLTDTAMKSSADYFSSCDLQLKKLNLSHNAMGSKGASMLFNSLSMNNSIEYLNISFNGIDNTLFEKYKDSLERFFFRNRKLTTLYYTGNYIPPSAMDTLAQNIIANTKLAYLYLDNNQINDEGLEYLSALVSHNAKLAGLHLAFNKFTHIGLGKLLEQIAWRTLLVELDLSQNNLSEKSIKLIVDTLSKNRRISALNLSNNLIKDGTMIAQLIKVNTSLKNLNLSNCHLGLESKKICAALEVNKKLGVIDLSVNEIGKNKEIIGLVSNMLRENFHLRFVYLDENYLTDDDLIEISEGLKNNKNVNSIMMRRNKIELKRNVISIYKNLRKNDHVKVIDLEENPISNNENYAEFKKVLSLNGTIKNIDDEI